MKGGIIQLSPQYALEVPDITAVEEDCGMHKRSGLHKSSRLQPLSLSHSLSLWPYLPGAYSCSILTATTLPCVFLIQSFYPSHLMCLCPTQPVPVILTNAPTKNTLQKGGIYTTASFLFSFLGPLMCNYCTWND